MRAVVLGLALVPIAGMWIFGGEFQRYTFATWAAPFYNAVYILFVLSLLNLILRKHWPSAAFNGIELLTVYAMVSVGSALMSSDLQGILVTLMGYTTYFADDANRWNDLFSGALPTWLIVNDKAALIGFYKGDSTFFIAQHFLPWLKPVIAWTAFIWALVFMMLCMNAILRKAWVERERLTFPIVALPMAMTDRPEAFFKNRLMWIGFMVAGTITLINGLNHLYPSIPYIPIKRQSYQIAASGPLMGLGQVTIALYFFGIAIGYLMPLDLSFSIYVFYFLYKLELMGAYMMGAPLGGKVPYVYSQAFGAYIAILLAAVWGLKGHLRRVWDIAFHGANREYEANEPIRYRTAIIGFGLSSVFLLFFSKLAGMSGSVVIVFFVIYLAVLIVITRIRAEFGFPITDLHEMSPDSTMVRLAGAEAFDRSTLGAFTMFYWFNRVFRSYPTPHQLEAMKMAGSDGNSQRAMFRAILLAGMLAVPACFLIYVNNFYHYGAATANVNRWGVGYGEEAFEKLAGWMASPMPADIGEKIATGFGFMIALGLGWLRGRFAQFPFHPLAYAVANTRGVLHLWLPILVGSACKAFVLRGSGLSGYRKAIMFFFGLMLGEYAIGCSWTLYGLIRGIPTYNFWP